MRILSPGTTHDDVTAGSRAEWLYDLGVFVPLNDKLIAVDKFAQVCHLPILLVKSMSAAAPGQ